MNNIYHLQLMPSPSSEGSIVVCHHEDPKFIFNSYASCRIILESGLRLMPMSSFINAFFGRFSQILNENAIKAMKHAVLVSKSFSLINTNILYSNNIFGQIIVQNGVKSVCISPLMLFVLRMISVLETMNIVTIADFKTCLNLGISDCFRFGYPNFNSLIQAFPDVFLFSSGVTEMSEVVLNKQSICKYICNG